MSDRKVAVITAGGSGMGAGAARRLAAEGFRVAVLSSSGKGEALGRELGGIGFTGSNRSDEDIRRFVGQVTDAWGRIDVLVNSAGHGPRGPVGEMSDADWTAGMDVYFLSAVRPARAVAPIMAAGGGGSIINISSYIWNEPEAAFPTSSVFRAGLAAYAKLFAAEWAARGVRMNNLCPGFIDSLPENAAWKSKIPTGRYGRVEEIAATVAFLASEGAAYITGQNIAVDGGIGRAV